MPSLKAWDKAVGRQHTVKWSSAPFPLRRKSGDAASPMLLSEPAYGIKQKSESGECTCQVSRHGTRQWGASHRQVVQGPALHSLCKGREARIANLVV